MKLLFQPEVNQITQKTEYQKCYEIDNEISHEDFTTIIDEERNYRDLKERIRMMKSQRGHIERKKLIENGKRIDTDEIIRQGDRINNSLKSQV